MIYYIEISFLFLVKREGVLKFLINEIIEFTCLNGELKNIKNHNVSMLNHTNSLILKKIIENGKSITYREEIFSDIFEVTNSKKTDGNLNQCVASIRKSLNDLDDINNIIITIPKQGFSLDEHVNISEVSTFKISSKKLKLRSVIKYIVVLLLLIFPFYLLRFDNTHPAISKAINIDKCTINFLAHKNFLSSNGYNKSIEKSDALEFIKSNNINCEVKSEIFIYELKLEKQEWMYIGRCENSYSCDSLYISEYKS